LQTVVILLRVLFDFRIFLNLPFLKSVSFLFFLSVVKIANLTTSLQASCDSLTACSTVIPTRIPTAAPSISLAPTYSVTRAPTYPFTGSITAITPNKVYGITCFMVTITGNNLLSAVTDDVVVTIAGRPVTVKSKSINSITVLTSMIADTVTTLSGSVVITSGTSRQTVLQNGITFLPAVSTDFQDFQIHSLPVGIWTSAGTIPWSFSNDGGNYRLYKDGGVANSEAFYTKLLWNSPAPSLSNGYCFTTATALSFQYWAYSQYPVCYRTFSISVQTDFTANWQLLWNGVAERNGISDSWWNASVPVLPPSVTAIQIFVDTADIGSCRWFAQVKIDNLKTTLKQVCSNVDQQCELTQAPSVVPTVFPTTRSPSFTPTRSPTFTQTTISPTFAPSSTIAPSRPPTITPTTTVKPTQSPSVAPSSSVSPTIPPTVIPSTEFPFKAPTPAPSFTQSVSPSVFPSTPTAFNTASPTASPSATPTTPLPPTVTPSTLPTTIITVVPTRLPSVSPSTESPSKTPTRNPSFGPTVFPTDTNIPTVDPSSLATNSPSKSPSQIPTYPPTATPSLLISSPMPTDVPTITKTDIPSDLPTVIIVPSASPTRELTPTFTVQPSVAPTPFVIETVFPTVLSTLAPLATPTATPTQTPSVVPTESPTVTDSQTPTLIPSVDPTMTPTTVPTIVPSFHPSAPTYSPSGVPTPVSSSQTQALIIVNAGFTMNLVNGETLTVTSQETMKQSIANVSQTTLNNVELVSVTRTNRRLVSSVVHRMLAAVPLFSYKVVAEIHFNLIDFPGLSESYVAGTKSNVLMQAMESHEFDRIISYYAFMNNVSQLMSASASGVSITTTIIPAPEVSSSSSETENQLTDGQLAGLVAGVVVGTVLVSVLIYFVCVVRGNLLSRTQQSVEPSSNIPVTTSENGGVDITNVYEQRDNGDFDSIKKFQLTTSSPDKAFTVI
jgi:hypothetical protein